MLNFLLGAATAAIVFGAAIGAIALAERWGGGGERARPETGAAIAPAAAAVDADAAADAPASDAEIGVGAGALAVRVAPAPAAAAIAPYKRSDWLPKWADADGDCQDTRQETLIAEALGAVEYEGGAACRVARGAWLGAYTGELFSNPRALDIDHLVPLGNAHRSGGWRWDRERKRAYANYLARGNHLIAVKAGANRQKGDKGPEAWRPPRAEYHCRYAAAWVGIKHRWGLTATPAEFAALREMLATCEVAARLTALPANPDAAQGK